MEIAFYIFMVVICILAILYFYIAMFFLMGFIYIVSPKWRRRMDKVWNWIDDNYDN